MSDKIKSRKDEIIAVLKKWEVELMSVTAVYPSAYEVVAKNIEKLFEVAEQPKIELVFKKEREDGISCCQVTCAYYFTRSENCCAGWNDSGSIIEVCQGYKPVKQYR